MILTIVTGIIIIFHGWVHIIYAGQSLRIFRFYPDFNWPEGSWLFAKLAARGFVRALAAVLLLLAGLGFMGGGVGHILQAGWANTLIAASALLSCLIYIVFWDGKLKALPDQGAIGILINLVILVFILI